MSLKKTFFKESDAVLRETQYWCPPISLWKPLKKTLSSNLCMACVVEDRLYQGLRFEGKVLLLTPENWKQVLKYGKPDFLLMESIWTSATGHWHMGQCPAAPGREELLEIIKWAQKLSIPTIFWITKGYEYHDHYKDFAGNFNFVFCADPKEAELLRAEGIPAEILLPCVQPALYNPFRFYQDNNVINLGILYDGWADLDRMTDQLSILKEMKPYGLSIIESRYYLSRNRMDILPDYKTCIAGLVTPQNRILALKYAKAYITFDQTLSTRTTQQWMALEAAASGLAAIHHGNLADGDIRKDILNDYPSRKDFLSEIARVCEDPCYWEQNIDFRWRTVCRNYTYAQRIQTICNRLSIHNDLMQWHYISIINLASDLNQIKQCYQTYIESNYKNKELIIVYRGECTSIDIWDEYKDKNDISIYKFPTEVLESECLWYAINAAKGKLALVINNRIEFDVNDYIHFMAFNAQIANANLFGDLPPFYYYNPNERPNDAIDPYLADLLKNSIHQQLNAKNSDIDYKNVLFSLKFAKNPHHQNFLVDINLLRKNKALISLLCDPYTENISETVATANRKSNSKTFLPEEDIQIEDQAEIISALSAAVSKTTPKPKISIIIPVYNKAEHIGNCLNSILNSGYQNVEVICIDDKSTDSSKTLIKEYARTDKRIGLISNPINQGAGKSRNTGIASSKGKYLFFLDADDRIAEGALTEMAALAENRQCDIVRGKITGIKKDGSIHRLAAEHLLHNKTQHGVTWKGEESLWYYWYFTSNLYNREFVVNNRIVFPNGVRNEDPFFLCRCFLSAEKITLYNEIVYYYFVGEEQRNKTPSLSFLTGWSLGNYYLYQLICTQFIQTQYFLTHFPSLLKHSLNAVKCLDRNNAINILKYLQLMFKKVNLEFISRPESQPWERKKDFPDEYIAYVNLLKFEKIKTVYTRLLDY